MCTFTSTMSQKQKDEPTFFERPEIFRQWLHLHHDSEHELWVGFYKKKSGKVSITWPESVDEALCYGWIDGIRKSIDDISYKIRFTPRKPRSHWSAVNIGRVEELTKLNRMHHSGIEAFNRMATNRAKKSSYEQKNVVLDKGYEMLIRAQEEAWDYFSNSAPSYQKTCIWWVMSAKKEETRTKRMQILIDSCIKGEKIPPLRWSK